MELKGENKQRWFTFCEYFKEEVEDYNLATIMRIRVDGVYSESNTIIVPKVVSSIPYFAWLHFCADKTSLLLIWVNGNLQRKYFQFFFQ